MRALLVFVASGLGLGAWWRKRRSATAELPYESSFGVDPAAELRAKLAESKPPVEVPQPAEEPAQAEPELSDPEKRRRALHEQARASIDELH